MGNFALSLITFSVKIMIESDMAIIYKYAKQVYSKELRQVDAIDKIKSELVEWNFNKNSFIDFCAALRHMLNGTKHTRGISTDLRAFYLEKIYEEFGAQKLSAALNAYMMHIQYYEDKHHTNRLIERKIYQKFLEIINREQKIDVGLIDELKSDEVFYEGGVEQVIINKYSRSTSARQKCIDKYGAKCSVCELKFEDVYGELGYGFIHVHHLVPISSIKEIKEITCDDLRPVCPNCHAMLHKGGLSIKELRAIIKKH